MKLPPYAKIVIILIGFIAAFFILYIGRTLLIPIFIALLFSLLMLPFSNWLESKGTKRGWAAFLSIFALFILLAGLGYFIVNQVQSLAQESDTIQKEFSVFIQEIRSFFEEEIGIEEEQQEKAIEQAQEGSGGIFNGLMEVASSLFIASILLPMSMYFMMVYRSYYKEFFFRLYSEDKHEKIKQVFAGEKKIIVKYITGIFTVVIILAICNVTALTLFGLQYALLFGVLAAILNIIPIIGTLVGSLLPVFYALIMRDSIWYPIGIGLYFWGIQILESSIITPNVVGSNVRINPFAIILAIFIGGEVWGAFGMVLFIPMLALITVFCRLVEPLKPYGFLLTDPEAEKEGFLKKGFNKLKNAFK